MIRNLELFGDTMGKGAAFRLDWSMETEVPIAGAGEATEKPLLWIGCSGSFHPGNAGTIRSLVDILKKANYEFVVLGKQEICCGEPARPEPACPELAEGSQGQLQSTFTSCSVPPRS